MKIPLGGGAYLEPDEGPRSSQWHKKIVSIRPIANTRTGHWIDLECGHQTMAFGQLERAGGVMLCTRCRDEKEKK